MTGTIASLSLAVACFVGGHFILSSVSVRGRAVAILGETGFRAFYSLAAVVTMAWTVIAYRAAPEIELWRTSMTLTHVPAVLMPLACILCVAGLTTRSVTMVGGEDMAGEPDTVFGIATITRHPFLWGVALWAIGHIVANGEAAGLV
ncbi:MAG: NnrU protein, partial [Proteobacteria bacterium]|nr:NnrU protein [Pseudomonadota bacterium]